MTSTIFLLQLFGLVCIVMGISVLLNRSHYQKMFQSLKPHGATHYLLGVLPLLLGLSIILLHNRWNTGSEIIVSLLGWTGVLKGIVRLLLPEWSVRAVTSMMKGPWIPVWGVVVLIMGAAMTWMGFWM